jgi:hypothetical protein
LGTEIRKDGQGRYAFREKVTELKNIEGLKFGEKYGKKRKLRTIGI